MHRIICDENIPKWFVHSLRECSFDVLYIAENHKSIEDIQICDLLNKSGGVLLTRDKDFGDLVFRLGAKIGKGNIILIKGDIEDIENTIIKQIRFLRLKNKQFLVISEDKIRIREM